jgi:hypothetical protein
MDCWIVIKAFSSEVGTGSREENASKRETWSSVLIQSEPSSKRANYKISAADPIALPRSCVFSTPSVACSHGTPDPAACPTSRQSATEAKASIDLPHTRS